MPRYTVLCRTTHIPKAISDEKLKYSTTVGSSEVNSILANYLFSEFGGGRNNKAITNCLLSEVRQTNLN